MNDLRRNVDMPEIIAIMNTMEGMCSVQYMLGFSR
jgi:hypothetical protein